MGLSVESGERLFAITTFSITIQNPQLRIAPIPALTREHAFFRSHLILSFFRGLPPQFHPV